MARRHEQAVAVARRRSTGWRSARAGGCGRWPGPPGRRRARRPAPRRRRRARRCCRSRTRRCPRVHRDAVVGARALRVDEQALVRQACRRPHGRSARSCGAARRGFPPRTAPRSSGEKARPLGAAMSSSIHLQLAARRVDAVDRRAAVPAVGRRAFPVAGDAERRVGEPDAAVARADDVVGRVQALALVAVGQHGDAAVVFGARDAPRQVLAGQQPALAVARVAVGVVRRLRGTRSSRRCIRPSAGCGCWGCR